MGTGEAPPSRLHASPLHVLTPSAGRAPQNGVQAQRERLLARLQRGSATRGALARECYCPSVTKRVSELRRMGHDIRSEWVEEREPDGSVSPTTLYSMAADSEAAQLALPLD
jgi:hypothetical protein